MIENKKELVTDGMRFSFEQDISKTLLENIPDFLYFKDKDRKFVKVSNSFCNFLDCNMDAIIGKKDEDLFPKEIAKVTSKEDQQIIETGKPLINKVEGGEIAGVEKWVLTTKLPWHNEEGKIIGLFGFSKDITERKKAEEKIRESEEKYKNLTENLSQVIYRADPNTFVATFVNKSIEKIYGYTPKEWLKDHNLWENSLHLDDKERVFTTFIDAKKNKKNIIIEYRIIRKNNEIRWVKDHVTWVEDDNGNLKSLNGILYDITEKKKAEGKLRQSEEFNKNIIANIPSAIIIFDNDLKLISANYTFYSKYNGASKKMIGKTIYDVLPIKHLNQTRVDKKILKVFKTGKIIEDIGLELNISSLGERIFNIKYVPIVKLKATATATATATNVMMIIEDITKLKKLEKDKKILSEKVIRLSKKIPLTQNEKLVFYGLVKYSLFNDQQLSNKLNIKRSTITAIKNKLLKLDFYSSYIIPNFEQIGCDLLCILHGKIPRDETEEKKKIGIFQKIISSPEFLYHVNTDEEFLSILVSKNFIEVKKLIDDISFLCEDEEDIEIPNILYFPFATSEVSNLFDYSGLLKSLFNLNVKKELIKSIKSNKKELTKNEKIILYALTKYPNSTDSDIAVKTKISRPTVSLIKKKLLEENFFKLINIPNLKKINCELFVYSNEKIDLENKNLELSSLIFRINSERENGQIFIFEDYGKYKKKYDELRYFSKKKKDLERYLFPIRDITYEKMNFVSLVKKVLGLEIDF